MQATNAEEEKKIGGKTSMQLIQNERRWRRRQLSWPKLYNDETKKQQMKKEKC